MKGPYCQYFFLQVAAREFIGGQQYLRNKLISIGLRQPTRFGNPSRRLLNHSNIFLSLTGIVI
jgi:hypothetical protein